MENLEISIEEFSGAGVSIRLAGQITDKTLDPLACLLGQLRKRGISRLRLHLNQVAYVSTAGTDLLLETLQWVRQLGGEVVLAGASRQLQEVFELLGVASMFRLEETLEHSVTTDRSQFDERQGIPELSRLGTFPDPPVR